MTTSTASSWARAMRSTRWSRSVSNSASPTWWISPVGRPTSSIQRCLSTADVCLSPDPLNPLNDVSTMNKVVEYMAMGRPIVSFDLVETRVSADDAAVYVKDNDELAFAKAIDALLQDPERRRQMGESGRRRVATGAFLGGVASGARSVLRTVARRGHPEK